MFGVLKDVSTRTVAVVELTPEYLHLEPHATSHACRSFAARLGMAAMLHLSLRTASQPMRKYRDREMGDDSPIYLIHTLHQLTEVRFLLSTYSKVLYSSKSR